MVKAIIGALVQNSDTAPLNNSYKSTKSVLTVKRENTSYQITLLLTLAGGGGDGGGEAAPGESSSGGGGGGNRYKQRKIVHKAAKNCVEESFFVAAR